jgi:hypothetical protein
VPPEEKDDRQSSISVHTLLISSLAAVAAAVIVPMFWERGSLIATAVTPVIVAIVSEALNRPAKVITKAAPKVARRTATGAALRSPQPTGVGARGEGPERVSKWGDEDDPFGLRTPKRARRRRVPWKLAVGTGLLAAVVGATVVTASELAIFGHSVGHSNRTTSVFGGSESKTPTPTASPEESATPTETATEEPTETAAPKATESATATPSASATTTPSPATQTATPVPTEASPAPTP